jgi:hypothetical protein
MKRLRAGSELCDGVASTPWGRRDAKIAEALNKLTGGVSQS